MEALNSKPLGVNLSGSGALTRSRQQRLERHGQAGDGSDPPAAKRSRSRCRAGGGGALCPYELCLYVRWISGDGRTKVNRLPLEAVASVGDLRGLFRGLVTGAFGSSGEGLPDYLTSPAYYLLSPAEDFVTLPGDFARTQFRLVATLAGGWEHTLVERELGRAPDPARTLLVTVAEFECEPAPVGGGREVVLSLIAYPTVCVRRDFLDDAVARLAAAAAGGAAA